MEYQAYFISDVHLKSKDDREAQILLRFLRHLHSDLKVTHLFLVGDIFDFWISDHPYFIQKFHPIVEELDRLVNRGVEINYFEGNHDLYLEKYWHGRLGVKVFRGPHHFDFGGYWVRVEHGDLIDPDDRGYLFLKRALNTSALRVFAEMAPEKLVSKIGERASRVSRRYTSTKKAVADDKVIEKIRRHAEQACAQIPFDLLVTGHVHVKDDYEFTCAGKTVRSVNLGVWAESPCAFMITPTKKEFVMLV